MKTRNLFWLFTILSVAFFSCNNPNSSPSNNDHAEIIGTWNMQSTHIIKYADGKRVDDHNETFHPGEYSRITFKQNYTYLASSFTDGHKVTESGTYALENGELRTKPTPDVSKSSSLLSLPAMNCKIDGDKMLLSIKGNDGSNNKNRTFNLQVILLKEENI